MPVRLMSPPGYPHAAGLAELAETVEYGLGVLALPDEPTIVLGAHLPGARVPAGAIIYNTEHPASPWMTASYRALLAQHQVWSYYAGGPGLYVPVGYAPTLTRIPVANFQDIDILFYGSVNERRLDVLLDLRARGLYVEVVTGKYGPERDALIARAKVVLNMHYYLPGIFEAVRVSYLWANRKCVVSEASTDHFFGCPYRDLAHVAELYVRNGAARHGQAEACFDFFSTKKEEMFLAEALCTPVS